MKFKIIGAGSIGNHLTNACRRENQDVVLCDVDKNALRRTEFEIYPSRYGKWDPNIRLMHPTDCATEAFDVTVIGTPPDSHVPIALNELQSNPSPKILLIEKPLCPPSLIELQKISEAASKSSTRVLVAYNHRLTRHSDIASNIIKEGKLAKPLLLNVGFQESWKGIFDAHPWLNGPSESYLGHWSRGGGAGGEHSHGINLWQYFAELSGAGRINEVSALVDYIEKDGAYYDQIFHLNLRTELGLCGSLFQDVITFPSRKWLTFQFENGKLEWVANETPNQDAVSYSQDRTSYKEVISKTRPDDFLGEIRHIISLLHTPENHSPLDLKHGILTMQVLIASHLSAHERRTYFIDHSASDVLKSVVPN